MSDDLYAYRANDEGAAVVHEFRAKWRAAGDGINAFNAAHPDNNIAWFQSFGDMRAGGFADGAPDSPPPEGLSRASTRKYLTPKRTKAGKAWQAVLDEHNAAVPNKRTVFEPLRIPYGDFIETGRGFKVAIPGFHDYGPDAVYFTIDQPFDPVPDCLAPVPLSEFYAAKEAADAARAGDTA